MALLHYNNSVKARLGLGLWALPGRGHACVSSWEFSHEGYARLQRNCVAVKADGEPI